MLAAALLATVSHAAEPPAEPTRLRPDANLPPRVIEVDLGEQRYSVGQEQREARQVVEFYRREVGFVEDPDTQRQIEFIGHRIITAAAILGPRQVAIDRDETPPLRFTFRVVDSDDVNAFSTWDGNIYLTRGMIEFCQSDDELAGVLGHEVAHSMYHHLRHAVDRLRRYQQQQILAMILAGFMGVNVANVGQMMQFVHLAIFNGHSVEDERQADYAGCFYTYRAGYNPVGMITVFERLHRLYRRRPNPTFLGAFQTHPWSDERAEYLEAQIRAMGVPINRRAVTDALTAGVRVTPVEDGPPRVELVLGDEALCTLGDPGRSPSVEDRAADSALAINRALHRGLNSGQLRLEALSDHYVIRAVNRLQLLDLVELRPGDASLAGQSLDDYAHSVYLRFKAISRQDELVNGAL